MLPGITLFLLDARTYYMQPSDKAIMEYMGFDDEVVDGRTYQFYQQAVDGFWNPTEIDLSQDKRDWEALSEEQHDIMMEFVANFIGEANIITGTVSETGSEEVGIDVDLPGAGTIDIPKDGVTTSMAVGDEIMLNIRPENVRISPIGQNHPDPVLPGTLTTSTFHGKNTRHLVQVDEREFIVETSGQSTVGEYTHGQEVGLTWDPADILVIKNGRGNQNS